MNSSSTADTSDLETKCASFRRSAADDIVSREYPPMQISVRREQVFTDSFKTLYYRTNEEMKCAKIEARFSGEESTDAIDSTTAAWFTALTDQICNPDFALFRATASGRVHPSPLSEFQPEHPLFFRFAGRIVAKGLFEGWTMNLNLSTAMYQAILGKPCSPSGLQDVDPESHQSLTSLLHNDVGGDAGSPRFVLTVDKFGVPEEVELLDNGRNILVNHENKHLYADLVIRWHLMDSVRGQVDSFLDGFRGVLPVELGSMFTEQELEVIISGRKASSIDNDQ
nr:e3 ubiquitin-protein ligase tom1-like [Quercus suber]